MVKAMKVIVVEDNISAENILDFLDMLPKQQPAEMPRLCLGHMARNKAILPVEGVHAGCKHLN